MFYEVNTVNSGFCSTTTTVAKC